METVTLLLGNLEQPLALHGLVFVLNLLVLVFAGTILGWFNPGKSVIFQAAVLRLGAMIFLIMHLLDVVLVNVLPSYQNYFIRFGLTVATLLGSLIVFNIFSHFSRQKFGREREIEGDVIYLDSYNSRLMDMCASVVIFLVALYLLIVIWELDDLLQTTGFLGIIFAFLALTNAIWAPDLYYGMVVLNSNMLEDGDVVRISGHPDEYVIARVSLIYTTLLDVRNNHRVLIRNSQLISSRVDNLSKRASADGIRHYLDFNIGYPETVDQNNQQEGDINPFNHFMSRVEKMFQSAYDDLIEREESKLNPNIPFEIILLDSGNYALTFRLYYYVEAIPNTKVTKTVRQYLSQTPSLIQQAVNRAASAHGIELATPVLYARQESDHQRQPERMTND